MIVTIDEVTLSVEIDGAEHELKVGIVSPGPMTSRGWVEHQVQEFLAERGALTGDNEFSVMLKLALFF